MPYMRYMKRYSNKPYMGICSAISFHIYQITCFICNMLLFKLIIIVGKWQLPIGIFPIGYVTYTLIQLPIELHIHISIELNSIAITMPIGKPTKWLILVSAYIRPPPIYFSPFFNRDHSTIAILIPIPQLSQNTHM